MLLADGSADGVFDPEQNETVRQALTDFRVARLLAGFFSLASAAAAYRATAGNGSSMFMTSMGCLATALTLELSARVLLVSRLVREAMRHGMRESLASANAERFLKDLLDSTHFGEPSLRKQDDVPMSISEIIVTQLDLQRLGAVLEASGPVHEDAADRLHDELVRARVVAPDTVPPDVVTMNSRVCFEDESVGVKREITLVYPPAADAAARRVSILSPLGCALLGLRVGQAIEWPLPNGRRKRYRVLAVPYQPEASGHFHL